MKIGNVHFDRCRFVRNVLQSKWYNGLVPILTLRIENSNIQQIEDNAFGTWAFENTLQLDLIDLPIRELKQNAFNGLVSLRVLTLSNLLIHRFDEQILASCKILSELYLFDFPHSELEFIELTGTDDLPSITKIQFNGNDFGAMMSRFTFWGLCKIKEINLRDNKITKIESGTFDRISHHLKYLDLSKNRLKTMPSNLLKVISTFPGTFIHLEENDWICNCDLEHLHLLMQTFSKHFFEYVYCTEPNTFVGQRIIDINNDFCVPHIDDIQDISRRDVFGFDRSAAGIMNSSVIVLFIMILIY